MTSQVDVDKSLIPQIPPKDFNPVVQKLRSYCLEQGMLEVHPQNRLSILAACEDPSTISVFDYHNNTWPLPQTNQMWLEHDLLRNPDLPGVFCTSTSYITGISFSSRNLSACRYSTLCCCCLISFSFSFICDC